MSSGGGLASMAGRPPTRAVTQRWTSWKRAPAPVWIVRIAVALGIVLRVRNWAANASLWLDEMQIAANLQSRGFLALTHPLGRAQAAPIGWLWSERVVIDLFGEREDALRLVPLLASIVGLLALVALAGRVAGPWVAAVAAVLYATSPDILFYAAEVKQYSTDAAAVTLVLLLTVLVARDRPGPSRLVGWAVACAVLVWFSFPAVVVAAVCGTVLAVRWIRSVRGIVHFVLPAVLLGLSIVGEDAVTLRSLGQNTVLDRYWQAIGGYPPPHGSSLSWLGRAVTGVVRNPVGLTVPVLAVVFALAGLLALALERPTSAAVIASPVVVGLALAVAHRYPLYQRLAIFLVPSILLLVAAGAVGAGRLASGRLPRSSAAGVAGLAAALLVIAVAPSVTAGVRKLDHPDQVTAGRQAMQFVSRNHRPGDLVLAESPWGVLDVLYYGRRFGVAMAGVFRARAGCTEDQLGPVIGRPRVWFVLAHTGADEPADRAQIYLSHLEQRGTLLASYTGVGGAAAYLLDFAEPPPGRPPVEALWQPDTCVSAAFDRAP